MAQHQAQTRIALYLLYIAFALCFVIASLPAQQRSITGTTQPGGAGNSRPGIAASAGYHTPSVRCISAGTAYTDSLVVFDMDLKRHSGTPERLRVWVAEPATGFTVSPSVISGPIEDGTAKFVISTNAVPAVPGKLHISLIVADEQAYTNSTGYEVLDYYITVSLPTPFSMPLTVFTTNATSGNHSTQTLTFGTGQRATTGFETGERLHTDSDYCEYELPPLPPTGVFDARWYIPATNGTLRNIYPERADGVTGPVRAWIGTFQRGTDGGIENSPVRIRWSRNDARRNQHPLFLRDQMGAVFSVNMKTGEHAPAAGITVQEIDADNMEVAISLSTIQGFKIEEDQASSVKVATGTDARPGIDIDCTPNPVQNIARIRATLGQRTAARIEIFDEAGNLARSLAQQEFAAGDHVVEWDGTDNAGRRCANGMYGCRLTAGSRTVWTWVVLKR